MDPLAATPIPDTPADTPEAPSAPLRWVVFCRVVDNLGDIGVCWRLCADLAARGHRLQLWIDQPGALAWMAPGALEGRIPRVQVHHWTADRSPTDLTAGVASADVWVEAFGCEADATCVQALGERVAAGGTAPLWINLEYLSAESYVERSHTLPSPLMSGPARGLTRWYFYPGFTGRTGGLLREPDLLPRQAAFDASQWLAAKGLATPHRQPERPRRASLFCYEPSALAAVLQGAGLDTVASDWFVTHGRAAEAVAAALPGWPAIAHDTPAQQCRLHPLPRLPQRDFDHLLWACDLNFVRGEDSLVRALWAGQPFVWHIYPQHDNAHHAKLHAFLDWLQAPPSLRSFHLAWNGIGSAGGGWPGWAVVDSWRACAQAARERLLAQPDLVTQLLGFVGEKR
ncbi:MAG: elongation factor P maturation arginine rhamnosyltransferase EarP [Hydrogenophaga sp.]|nr:elongation factor P maturation arginine rhamnosyltransferase EarP [Hydrogenophaga sp.]